MAVATFSLGRLLVPSSQAQHLYNRTWALLASTRMTCVTDQQRDALIDEPHTASTAFAILALADGELLNAPVGEDDSLSRATVRRRQ